MRGRMFAASALATGVAVVAAVVFPTRLETVVVAWAGVMLAGAALATSGAMRALVAGPSSAFESLLHRPAPRPLRPEDLQRCERLLSWRRYSGRDFDHHLRPLLVALTQQRLHNSSATLGPELTTLLADSPAEHSYPQGVTTADLERIVAAIESL